MKQIMIKCFSNGKTTSDVDFLYFDRENDTTLVTIEYPSEVALWHKRADILVGFDKSTDFKTGTDETLSFLLGAEHLKKGYLTIQPMAYVGTDMLKFEHVKFSVRTSLNVLENDTSVTTSVAAVLQAEIETLQDTKVDKEVGKGLSSNDYTDSEKSKLATIEEGAEVNVVTSVATKVGDVVLNKSDVGLLNVDNTSDLDKPISTATQLALNNKVDKFYATNLVQNGDFSNGTTGFTALGGTPNTISFNQKMIFNGTANASNGYVQDIPATTGNKLYFAFLAEYTSGDKPSIRFANFGVTGSDLILSSWVNGRNSLIFNSFVNGVRVYFRQQDLQVYNNVSFDNILTINLTQLFGTGNEPTKEQMDYLLSNFPNSWFNGTVELTNYRQLLNLVNTKANRVQEAWISATLIGGASNISGLTSRYKKDDSGVVWVELYYTGSFASFTKIMDFPVGYRPTQQIFVQGQSAYAYGNLYIDINGGVVHVTGTSTNNNRYLFCFRTN